MVGEDPQADVGEDGALRVALHSLRRVVAAKPDEAEEVLERRAPHERDPDDRLRLQARRARAVCLRDGLNRRTAASQSPAAPMANPPAAATEPARTRPRTPAAAARAKSRAAGDASRRATMPPAASSRRAPTSAARSWWPRNEGYLQPEVEAAKMSTPKQLHERDADVATALQRTIAPTHEVEVVRATDEQRDADREQRVLDELQVADQVVVEERRRPERRRTERLERQPREERRARDPEHPCPRRAGRAPSRARRRPRRPRTTTTATSERRMSTVVEPMPRPTSG